MHAPRFSQLDRLLTDTREFWQFMPFSSSPSQWEQSHPEFTKWLLGLDEQQLAHFKEKPGLLAEAVSDWIPQAASLQVLADLEALPHEERIPPRGLDTGIPGRKWQQLQAFNGVLPALQLPWLEWCAGKGFLGRVLAATHKTPVTSLEWQQALCESGETAARKLSLPMTFVHGDAFSAESGKFILSQQHAVALHACGDLHVSLLQRVADRKGRAVSVSPCCYHLIRNKAYQPMSALAKQSELSLSKHDLRLPLQETVTAGNRVRNLRFVEVSFRLGFDSLQRDVTGQDTYMPVPNVQKALFNDGFAAFCRWAAEQKGLVLPDNIDFAYWQQVGEQRFDWVERLELLRQLFRRPLEMWLVYDRACFMEEAGYEVTVGTFCDKPITPRNIMIHAELKD
ncbi:SAM-dependent methyltransferase [Photobacterium rosenbergii]|uniref:SAM-dependent methyltransferase n=1 Tax=Photobacterium rosenbergii TaxID=294936 RepID=A0A2T3NC53_9GAMM|nr:methyltransferase [Photobacterium rosenbergii]PSW11509.1 SAM-dependent methyltransferase [Photobacterium rosenbergii]